MKDKRPKHLALYQIKLPLPGWVSILHRVSGILLFLALPLLLLALQYSVASIETYTRLQEVCAHPLVKLILCGLLWSLLHHFCAGIRYLMIDLHFLRSLVQARASARVVLFASLAMTVWFGGKLW